MQLHAKKNTYELKIKNQEETNHEKRTAHWYIATYLLLKALKQRLIDLTLFRLSKSLYSRFVLFKRTKNFGSGSPNPIDRRIYDIKFLKQVFPIPHSPPPIFYLSYYFNFPLDAVNFPFIRDLRHVIT